MSESTKAVFLSYASQDAPAAKRISEALIASGIEVWFDKSALRGGDAWDQQIRRQIRDCALFIPVISATTASRHEGYFRLEWDLADQRSHKIARNRPFIVPVCLDATPDTGADVPESFSRVQWTRLPAGDTPPAFSKRIVDLLAPTPASADGYAHSTPLAATTAATPAWGSKSSFLWIGLALVLVIGYVAVDKLVMPKPELTATTPTPPPVVTVKPRSTGGGMSAAASTFNNQGSDPR